MRKVYLLDANTGKIYKTFDDLPENIKPIIWECYE